MGTIELGPTRSPEPPYIGVTGPNRKNQVRSLVNSFRRARIAETSHRGMIGLAIDLKLLPEDGRQQRYVYLHDRDHTELHDLLVEAQDPAIIASIHFNAQDLTPKNPSLSEQVVGLFDSHIPDKTLVHALQLNNLDYPDPKEIEIVRQFHPELAITIQTLPMKTEEEALEQARMIEALYGNGELVQYAAVNRSRSRGEVFYPEEIKPTCEAMGTLVPGVTPILAGGFSGDNVTPRLAQIKKVLNPEKILLRKTGLDSEGKVRDPGTDAFNPHRTDLFIQRGVTVYRRLAA